MNCPACGVKTNKTNPYCLVCGLSNDHDLNDIHEHAMKIHSDKKRKKDHLFGNMLIFVGTGGMAYLLVWIFNIHNKLEEYLLDVFNRSDALHRHPIMFNPVEAFKNYFYSKIGSVLLISFICIVLGAWLVAVTKKRNIRIYDCWWLNVIKCINKSFHKNFKKISWQYIRVVLC